MRLFLASSLFIALPLCWAVDVRPLPTENEVPQVIGSEVKVLPALPGGSEAPTTAAPAPIFSEPPEQASEPPAIANENQNSSIPEGEVNPEQPDASAANPFDFEPNVTVSNSDKKNANASIDENKKEKNASNALSPKKPLHLNASSANESLIGAGKNESDLILDLLSNNSDAGHNNSVAKILLPSKLQKVRVTVIGFTGKPVHTFNLTEDQVLYQMKVFWGEPDSWQDIGWRPSDRVFELFCWLATNGGFDRDLFRGNLSGSLITHSQWYAIPEVEDEGKNNISVNCALRAVNGAGKSGDWSFSDPAPVRDAPVFLRGFENVNVRGWTKEEVIRLVTNQKRHDSPQQAAAKPKPAQSAQAGPAAARSKSKKAQS